MVGSTASWPLDSAERVPGDAARAAFVARHLPHLQRVARSLAARADQADDLVQATVERALSATLPFDLEGPVTLGRERAWLVRVMKNLFIDGLRKERGRRVPLESTPEPEAPPPEPEVAWEHIRMADVQRAVERLPAGFRDVFVLFYFEGLSYLQIAERLGLERRTVGTRLLRARQKVRARLEEERASRGRG